VQGVIPQMKQRVEGAIGYDPNIAPSTAVAPRRPATRDKLLSPKGSYAIASAAALYSNLSAINKHLNRKRRPGAKSLTWLRRRMIAVFPGARSMLRTPVAPAGRR
jgi:hypothetical protein